MKDPLIILIAAFTTSVSQVAEMADCDAFWELYKKGL